MSENALARSRRRPISVGVPALAIAAVALSAAATPARAAVPANRYVATTGSDSSQNTCLVKAHPCRTIAWALSQAAAADTVRVGPGTFAEQIDLLTNDPSRIVGASDGVTTVTSPASAQGPTFIVQGGGTLSLQHLTVRGGIFIDTGALVVADSRIAGSAASVDVEHDGTASIRNTTITGLKETGVFNDGGILQLSGSTVSNTTGVVDPTSGKPQGIGIQILGGSTTITDSTITGNETVGVYAMVLAEPDIPAAVTIRNSTIADNGLAGIALGPEANTTIETSTIAANRGAGIYAQGSTTHVRNSTIAGTSATGQSGTLAAQGGVVLVAAAAGDTRLFTHPDAAGPATTLDLSGTIVAKNDSLPDCVGTVVDTGYNLSSDAANSCGFTSAQHSLHAADPLLGPLAANGGATKTLLPGAGSAALDVIPTGSAGCVAGATDQRGVSRPQPAAGSCDVGSVEVASPVVINGSSALPHGTVGEHYRHVFTATGGADSTYVWTLAAGSDQPAGLTLSRDGVLSGVPTRTGTFAVTVSVNDPVLKKFALVVDAAAAAVPTGAAPISNTGTNVAPLATAGGGAVLAGILLLLGAGLIRRSPGGHRTG